MTPRAPSKERVEVLRIFLQTTIKDRNKIGRDIALPYYRDLLAILDEHERISADLNRAIPLIARLAIVEAQLEKQRPLIEAAMGPAEITRDVWGDMLIKEALKLREEGK